MKMQGKMSIYGRVAAGIVVSTLTVWLPIIAVAAGVPVNQPAPADDFCGLIRIFRQIADAFAVVIGIVAVIMLLYSAFLFVTQSGSEDGVKSARTYLIYALVGLAVALLAFNAPKLVSSVVGGNIGQCA